MQDELIDPEELIIEEEQNRDKLFKIYYSEKMKKQLRISEDCNEINFKEILQLSNHYKTKRQYWNSQSMASGAIKHLDLKAITLNTVFLPKEQVQQAIQQQKFLNKLGEGQQLTKAAKKYNSCSLKRLPSYDKDNFQFITEANQDLLRNSTCE